MLEIEKAIINSGKKTNDHKSPTIEGIFMILLQSRINKYEENEDDDPEKEKTINSLDIFREILKDDKTLKKFFENVRNTTQDTYAGKDLKNITMDINEPHSKNMCILFKGKTYENTRAKLYQQLAAIVYDKKIEAVTQKDITNLHQRILEETAPGYVFPADALDKIAKQLKDQETLKRFYKIIRPKIDEVLGKDLKLEDYDDSYISYNRGHNENQLLKNPIKFEFEGFVYNGPARNVLLSLAKLQSSNAYRVISDILEYTMSKTSLTNLNYKNLKKANLKEFYQNIRTAIEKAYNIGIRDMKWNGYDKIRIKEKGGDRKRADKTKKIAFTFDDINYNIHITELFAGLSKKISYEADHEGSYKHIVEAILQHTEDQKEENNKQTEQIDAQDIQTLELFQEPLIMNKTEEHNELCHKIYEAIKEKIGRPPDDDNNWETTEISFNYNGVAYKNSMKELYDNLGDYWPNNRYNTIDYIKEGNDLYRIQTLTPDKTTDNMKIFEKLIVKDYEVGDFIYRKIFLSMGEKNETISFQRDIINYTNTKEEMYKQFLEWYDQLSKEIRIRNNEKKERVDEAYNKRSNPVVLKPKEEKTKETTLTTTDKLDLLENILYKKYGTAEYFQLCKTIYEAVKNTYCLNWEEISDDHYPEKIVEFNFNNISYKNTKGNLRKQLADIRNIESILVKFSIEGGNKNAQNHTNPETNTTRGSLSDYLNNNNGYDRVTIERIIRDTNLAMRQEKGIHNIKTKQFSEIKEVKIVIRQLTHEVRQKEYETTIQEICEYFSKLYHKDTNHSEDIFNDLFTSEDRRLRDRDILNEQIGKQTQTQNTPTTPATIDIKPTKYSTEKFTGRIENIKREMEVSYKKDLFAIHRKAIIMRSYEQTRIKDLLDIRDNMIERLSPAEKINVGHTLTWLKSINQETSTKQLFEKGPLTLIENTIFLLNK